MGNNILDIFKNTVTAFATPSQRSTYTQAMQLVVNTPVLLDFSPLINQHRMESPQGVYIDNSKGLSSVSLTVQATLQNITIPAGYQGGFMLPLSTDMKVIVVGNGNVTFVYTNFPLRTGVWPTTASAPITYTAAFFFTVAADGAFIQLKGSASKTVKIIQSSTSVVATAAANTILFQRLATIDMGGTQTVVQNTPYDLSDPPSTAICVQAPNGNFQGTDISIYNYATGTATFPTQITNYVPNPVGKLPTLRGVGQFFNIGAIGIAGQTIGGFISWTEE